MRYKLSVETNDKENYVQNWLLFNKRKKENACIDYLHVQVPNISYSTFQNLMIKLKYENDFSRNSLVVLI